MLPLTFDLRQHFVSLDVQVQRGKELRETIFPTVI